MIPFERYKAVDNDTCRQALINKGALLLAAYDSSQSNITFRHEPTVDVSVIIVAKDAPELLAVTLNSLYYHQGNSRATIELIVIDNASGLQTQTLLGSLVNVNVVRQIENIGFGGACNLGAQLSKGRALLFLNPDVEMLPGCIDALVDAIDVDSQVAIVGGRLVFPGGRLQEAGAALIDDWQLTHPYLRGHEVPFCPEALFRRNSAYVSGALMLVKSEIFVKLGGFDPAFYPAYFEDTDLCLRCWREGYSVIYEPRAVALHFESATSRSREDVDVLLNKNRGTFRKAHADWVFSAAPARSTRILDVRAFDLPRLKILMVDDRVPHEHMGSGYPRANLIVRYMVQLGYFVSIYPIHNGESTFEEAYQDIPAEVEILGGEYGQSFSEIIKERRDYYDVLWVSRPHNIGIVADLFSTAAMNMRDFVKRQIIFDAEALYATRDHVMAFTEGGLAGSAFLEAAIKEEIKYYHMADSVLCVSQAEQRLLGSFGLRNTEVLGYCAQSRADQKTFAERNEILFLGALTAPNSPNVDSLLWFVREVSPILSGLLGRDFRLKVVGVVKPEIKALFRIEDCDFLGEIEDLDEPLSWARVMVAPTRFASGVPIKFYEAISRNVPMVVTPVLAQQISWPERSGYLSADWMNPEGYASAIFALYSSEVLWNEVRQQGLRYLAEECGEELFIRRVRDLCEVNAFDY